MTTPSKNRFIAEATARLPGVTRAVIDQQLASLFLDFFEQTNAWYNEVEVDVEPDTLAYDLDTDEGQPHRIIWVKDENDVPVEVDLTLSSIGSPQIVLRNAVGTEQTYTVRVALLPSIYQPLNVPDWVYDDYRLTLLDGLLARLMLQPAKPYSNQQLGIYHERSYRGGVASARVEQTRSYRYGVQAWRFPQSFATRRR